MEWPTGDRGWVVPASGTFLGALGIVAYAIFQRLPPEVAAVVVGLGALVLVAGVLALVVVVCLQRSGVVVFE